MQIEDPRLKKYIHSNTTLSTREKAAHVEITSFNYDADGESVTAFIQGSARNKYKVNFYGLSTGFIMSSCSCPFDWGTVCKHEVAVAHKIDTIEYRRAIILDESPIKKKVIKTNEKVIPFIKDSALFLESLNIYASYAVQNANLYYYNSFKLISEKDNLILFESVEYQKIFSVELELLAENIRVKCTCKSTKELLCEHQYRALTYLANEMPLTFFSKEKVDEMKENLLAKYGFSLKDLRYEKYFEFITQKGEINLKLLKNGILPLSEYGELTDNFKALFTPEIVLKDSLPFKDKKPKQKQTKGIGVGVIFGERDSYCSVNFMGLIGNLDKTKTQFTTKIEEVEAEDLIYGKHNLDANENQLLMDVLQLSEEKISEYSAGLIESSDMDTYTHSELQEIIPKLENQLVYRMNSFERISKNTIDRIYLSKESSDLSFELSKETDFYKLTAFITIAGKKRKLSKKVGNNYLFVNEGEMYYLNRSISHCKAMAMFIVTPEIRFSNVDYDNYYNSFIKPLSKFYEIDFKTKKRKTIPFDLSEVKRQVYLKETNGIIVFQLVIEHEQNLLDVFTKDRFDCEIDGKKYAFERNIDFEKDFIDLVKTIHPKFSEQDTPFFFLDQEDFIEGLWFLDAIDTLRKNGITVFGFDSLSKLKYNTNKPKISLSINSGIDWFDVNITVAFGNLEVSLRDIKKSILNKSRYIQLKDGTMGVLPEEWMKKYAHLFRAGTVKKDTISVSKYQFSIIDTLFEDLDQELDFVKKHIAIKEKLASFEKMTKVPTPRGIKAKLRDYQREGLNWLNFTNEYNLGGCLADDMGLGKTLQVISLFKHLKSKIKNAHLVIVPTSLIFNWQDEINKFCPTLKVKVLTGGDREKDTKDFDKFDLILTTYGIVLRDFTYLMHYTFNYIVLDESQAIKNPKSQRYKTVCLLKSENRLALTGTPIENNTFDLYAQMSFLNPGLLGNMEQFKKEFSTPIDKNKNTEVAKELRNLINPFLLRRTKEQVATELPPKTEQLLYCTMGEEQQKLYDAYRNKYRDYLLKKIDDDGLGKSKMYVLEGLIKLRQICDSPQLLNDDENYTDESVKIEELTRHILEKTGGHKILVFSQFTKMLGLIKQRLDKEGVTYEYLDGRTRNRQERVENFQNNVEVRVFLISLKAGGTGLNLTEADYVYIVDPWWNPAVEAQAIDRCYRIGQEKKVMAYKMICKGTIEEKIVLHQQSKKQLSDDIIQTEESYMKAMSKESISQLFS